MSTRIQTRPRGPTERGALPRRAARPKDRLIFDLPHGQAGAEDEVVEEARLLGMDLSQPRAVLLVDASDHALGPASRPAGPEPGGLAEIAHVRARTRAVVATIVAHFMLPDEAICGDLGDGLVAVLKASNSRDLDGWVGGSSSDPLETPSWANLAALKRAAGDLLARLLAQTGDAVGIGVGRYHPGVDGRASSFLAARAALGLGRRRLGPNRVHCLDELGLAALVGLEDEETKIGLAHRLLSPLDHEPHLAETLDAFFAADCSPALAARRLGIHRNTLAYRLAKVASLTGLDPHRFDDAVQIRLARVLRELDGRPALPGR